MCKQSNLKGNKCNSSESKHHNKCHRKCQSSSFSHTFTLGTMDSTFLVNDGPLIDIVVSVDVSRSCVVKLTIPSFTFTIPESSLTPRDGFVYTVPSTNLPKSVWHSQGLPYSIIAATNLTLYVFNDGSIVVGAVDFQPLMAGTYTFNETKICYIIEPSLVPTNAPKNFLIADKQATVADIPVPYGNNPDLLDFYNNDIRDNVIAYTFSANPSNETTNPNNVNFYASVGTVNDCNVKIEYTRALYIPNNQPEPQLCIENTISINPTNKRNIVATSTFLNYNLPQIDLNRRSILRSYTFDSGNTWVTDIITGINKTVPFNIPSSIGDPNALFDDFGNHWLCYLVPTNSDFSTPIFDIGFSVSTDGGITYTAVGTIALNSFLDYPRLSFGGDGNGGKALWFSIDYVDLDIFYQTKLIIGYIQVSGLGSYGPLTYDFATGIGTDVATNSIFYLQVPEIVATNNGTIYLLAPTQIYEGDNGNYTEVVLTKHKGGINNFTQFETPVDIFISNVGGNNFETSALGKPVPFQPTRGVFPNGARGISYDNKLKRLWITGVNIKPNNFSPSLDTSSDAQYDMSIFTMYSDDGGKCWSPQLPISDTEIGPRALPSLQVDPKTSKVAYFWYDARDDPTGVSVKPFGAVLCCKPGYKH